MKRITLIITLCIAGIINGFAQKAYFSSDIPGLVLDTYKWIDGYYYVSFESSSDRTNLGKINRNGSIQWTKIICYNCWPESILPLTSIDDSRYGI